jgi:hypothetical protein
VWLATVLQIGGMVLLGQIAYVFICAALEVGRHRRRVLVADGPLFA